MHVEQMRAVGPMTEDDAHDLAAVAGRHRPCRVTVGCRGRSVHALVLPHCHDQLPLADGDIVAVTVEGPDADAERAALRDFAERFERVGAASQPPKTRSTTAFARRVIRR